MPQSKTLRPHYSTTTDSRVIKSRLALRDALLQLLDEKSLADITTPEITERAGIGYTTFYRHFTDKEELLNEIATEEINKLINVALSALDLQRAQNTRAAALTLCEYVDEHRSLWTTLLTGGAAGRLREEFIAIARGIAANQKHFAKWLPADAGILFGVGGTLELLTWWLMQEEPIPKKQFALIYDRLILTHLGRG